MARMRILQTLQNPGGRLNGFLDVRVTVSKGKKASLELRRSQIDPAVEHAMKILFELFAVARHGICQVMHRLLSKITAKHGAASVELYRHAGGAGSLLHSGFKRGAKFFETVIE